MGVIFGLLIDAAILGIVVAVMEKDEFPGWGPMIGCVFVAAVAGGVVEHVLPDGLWPLGVLAAAVAGGLMLVWLCGMTLRRGLAAAGIYLGIRLLLGLAFLALVSA